MSTRRARAGRAARRSAALVKQRPQVATQTASPAGRWVWLDGRIVRLERAKVAASDRGLLFGDGVFETVRCYAGRPFLWERHRARLERSLRFFGIAIPRFDLHRAIVELVDACAVHDAAVRVTVTRGVEMTLAPSRALEPTVLITVRAIDPELARTQALGAAAIRLSFGRGTGGVTAGHKTLDYLPAVLGSTLARRRRAREAIYVEADGTISEGTTSNVFLAVDGALVTPALSAGGLPGITRSLVLTLARRARREVLVRPIAARELDRAAELFVTSSVVEVLPIVRLDGRRVGEGRPGELTRLLQENYRRVVRRALVRSRE